jgi:hypothetical protein
VLLSCKDSRTSIDTLIHSEETNDVIMGFYLIGEAKDTSYIDELFFNIDDRRISHDLRFNGISVYQSKVSALRQISGLEPPTKITYRPDSVIINFYRTWAEETGFLE